MNPSRPRRFALVVTLPPEAGAPDDLVAAIEAQTFDPARVEVVVVTGPGTARSSVQVVERWQADHPDLVTVLVAPDDDRAGARNLGAAHARAEWVSFLDPATRPGTGCLTAIDAALTHWPRAGMAVARRVPDPSGGQHDPHPLDSRFARRARLRDLRADPEHFVDSTRATFFRLDHLREHDLAFVAGRSAEVEELRLCCRYALSLPTPLVAFVTGAECHEAVDGGAPAISRGVAGGDAALLAGAYLDPMSEAVDRTGRAPAWLQSMVLHGLSWVLAGEDSGGDSLGVPPDATDAFHDVLARVAAHLEAETVESFTLRRWRPVWRDLLLHAYRPEDWVAGQAAVSRVDLRQRLVQLRYRFTGAPPEEVFFVDGRAVAPAHAKTRSLVYFNRAVLQERVVWLDLGTITLTLDGRRPTLLIREPAPQARTLGAAVLRRRGRPNDPAAPPKQGGPVPTRRDRAELRLSRTRAVRRLFRDAWVLMDRVTDADDSAEILFHWIREHRPETNAWFVVDRDSPDFARLRRGRSGRVVAFGSLRHRLLMLHAAQLVSSHVIDPSLLSPLARPTWRTTFLNHGVIKDDLSNWLNPKNLDLFVTSTRAEYDSVAADGTAYQYTDRETVLTGMPRFDRLLDAASGVPQEEQRLLLLAPTWRHWLVDTSRPGRPSVDPAHFLASEFARQWLALVRSSALEALADEHGVQPALLLHPNLQSVRDRLDLPPHVRAVSFEGGGVRDVFARTRVLVTDYSSMAFNAAYLDRPVVYFQFDRDVVLGGAHLGRRGYFDYETHGFGPVATDVAQAVDAIGSALRGGRAPAAPYASRVADAFPHRDGRCSERTYEAIAAAARPRSTTGPPDPV